VEGLAPTSLALFRAARAHGEGPLRTTSRQPTVHFDWTIPTPLASPCRRPTGSGISCHSSQGIFPYSTPKRIPRVSNSPPPLQQPEPTLDNEEDGGPRPKRWATIDPGDICCVSGFGMGSRLTNAPHSVWAYGPFRLIRVNHLREETNQTCRMLLLTVFTVGSLSFRT